MKRIGWAVLVLGVVGWTVPAAAETWIQWVRQGFVGQPASWEVPDSETFPSIQDCRGDAQTKNKLLANAARDRKVRTLEIGGSVESVGFRFLREGLRLEIDDRFVSPTDPTRAKVATFVLEFACWPAGVTPQ